MSEIEKIKEVIRDAYESIQKQKREMYEAFVHFFHIKPNTRVTTEEACFSSEYDALPESIKELLRKFTSREITSIYLKVCRTCEVIPDWEIRYVYGDIVLERTFTLNLQHYSAKIYIHTKNEL